MKSAEQDNLAVSRLLASRWLLAALVLWGCANLSIGLYYALTYDQGSMDLYLRWREEKYICQGANPYDIHNLSLPEPVNSPRNPALQIDPELGPLPPMGYPPWGFGLGLLLVPPLPFEWTRLYFTALTMLALGVILRFTWKLGSAHDRFFAILLAASVASMSSLAISMKLGQYSLLMVALVILAYQAAQRKRAGLAGIFLGLAAIKPNISALFGLRFLIGRNWTALVSTTLVILMGTGITWWLTATSPMTMLSQMFQQSADWDAGDNGLIGLCLKAGLPRDLTTKLGLLLGVTLSLLIAVMYRKAPWLTQAALLTVIARLWMYHRRYDDCMLLFLLLALALLTKLRPKLLHLALFLMVGLTLWIPLKEEHQIPLVILWKVLTWIAAAIVVAIQPTESRAAAMTEPRP